MTIREVINLKTVKYKNDNLTVIFESDDTGKDCVILRHTESGTIYLSNTDIAFLLSALTDFAANEATNA